MKSCSSGEARGEEIARNCGDWKLGEELTGEGGRWRCSAIVRAKEGGLGWPEAVVRAREAVGTVGRSRGGVGEEWRRENTRDRERGASGERAARRRRGRGEKGREKQGVRAWGATRRGGVVGPGPDRRAAPGSGLSAARVGDVHRARACRLDREGREASDGWAEAQCQAAVPLTGVAGLSAARTGMGRGRAVARTRVGRPEKKGSWAARMHSTVLDFFELV
jgi:hypothetical protein